MAFDGAFLYKTISELRQGIDCHVDKIYQPTKDELVFLLRKKGFVKKLFISVKQGSARIHFTENKYENPAVPPNFCMLLRKYLSAARLIDITQPNFERIAELSFSATNELGDIILIKLICEFISGSANVILVQQNGRIIDALRRSDVETAKRLILSGAAYEYPPSLQKKSPFCDNIENLCRDIALKEDISKQLLNTFDGFSPLVCREIEYKAKLKDGNLTNALKDVVNDIKSGTNPVIILKPDGSPLEFSYTDIGQYGSDYKIKKFEDFSSLLDAFYTARDNFARIQSAAHDIIKLVTNLKNRTEKKLALRLCELKNCENRDTLRIYGELLKANLHKIKAGSRFAEVENYYDENLALIRIPLNPALSPSKNADKYFKDYKKTYTAEQTLMGLTENDKNELIYFDSVLDSIFRAETLAELSEIKDELCEAGYIKRTSAPKKAKPKTDNLRQYTSEEGFKILVGKNNTQNDLITTRLAGKNDMWFHVKNIAGSHVVVFSNGEPLSDATVLQAATLAAKNSKAATSSKVPVDYTPVKYVKKPAGAKPGMVIYTTNKTVFVTP